VSISIIFFENNLREHSDPALAPAPAI
jgi:hypothetical protein